MKRVPHKDDRLVAVTSQGAEAEEGASPGAQQNQSKDRVRPPTKGDQVHLENTLGLGSDATLGTEESGVADYHLGANLSRGPGAQITEVVRDIVL